MKNKIVVDLYCRVSTQEQAREGYSLEEQQRRLKLFADANGWKVLNTYVDGGFSGASLNRPGIQAVIRDAQARRIDRVVVYRLDRLSRSQKDTLHLIEDVFTVNGVSFVSMTESFDTSTPFGVAMIGILSVFAQLERETIRERMQVGRDAAIKQGGIRGGLDLIGYDHDGSKYVVVDYEAMLIKKCFDMYIAGYSSVAICKYFNDNKLLIRGHKWNTKKVISIIRQRAYIGYQLWKGEYYQTDESIYPRIIDEDTFNRANARLECMAHKSMTPYKHNFILGGKCYCGTCGSLMYSITRNNPKKQYRYYKCGSQVNTTSADKTACASRIFHTSEVDQHVIDSIRALALDSSRFNNIVYQSDPAANVSALEDHLADIDKQLEKLVDLYTTSNIDVSLLNKRNERLMAERDEVMRQISEINKKHPRYTNEQYSEMLQNFLTYSDAGDTENMRDVINILVKSVTLNDSGIVIAWNFS